VHLFTQIQCELVATVRIASKNPIHCCQQFLPTPTDLLWVWALVVLINDVNIKIETAHSLWFLVLL